LPASGSKSGSSRPGIAPSIEGKGKGILAAVRNSVAQPPYWRAMWLRHRRVNLGAVLWAIYSVRPICRTLSALPRTEFAHQSRVLAHLVAELLVHADDQGIGRLDFFQGFRETGAYLGWRADAPSRGQNLVGQARLLRRADGLEHPVRIGRQVK